MTISTAPLEHVSNLDRLYQTWQARVTGGLFPASLLLAYLDWLVHLGNSPGRQGRLIEPVPPCVQPRPQDWRFPFNLFAQVFLLAEQCWQSATTGIPGVSHHEDVVSFDTRQWLDTMAPSNFVLTNPDILALSPHHSLVKYLVDHGHTVFINSWKNSGSEERDPAPYTLIQTEHSHAAAVQGVALVRAGECDTLMRGSLHTDELMHAVLAPGIGLATGRHMSHAFTMNVPIYPRLRLLTDAALNIYPDLEAKRDDVQNAFELAHVLGIEVPKVAILSAVETVNPSIHSTLEATALCKMADRGQITGGVADGPLAFDNAGAAAAALGKGIVSPLAGQADTLVVPGLESGNMLAKQLEHLAEVQAAGIVVGARVPIMLPSRAYNPQALMASCAIAQLMMHSKRKEKP